jgi:hypothetical protein
MKNWNDIGAVIVYRYSNPNPKWYASLKDAMLDIDRGFRRYWEKTPLLDQINVRGWLRGKEGDGHWFVGDNYLIKDDLGLVIPHWKIVEVYKNLSYDDFNFWKFWYNHKKSYKFRDGSVPGIRCWKPGGRRPQRLWQALKNSHYDEHDENLKEFKFKRRDYGDRFADFVDWERYHQKDQKNWKKFRKTQWKS